MAGRTTAVQVTDQNVMQALIQADFELLGTKLVAEYFKDKDGKQCFLLMPTDEADARGITVEEMLADIQFLVGSDKVNTDELTKCIESVGLDIKSIKVTLKMAYFYLISDGTDTANNQTEYAFHLEIDTSSVLPDTFKLFNIEKLGFAVWNTDRAKIISQMDLYKPEDLLN
jgi:hypothetical protein